MLWEEGIKILSWGVYLKNYEKPFRFSLKLLVLYILLDYLIMYTK